MSTIDRDKLVSAIIAEGSLLEARPAKLEELAERIADRFRLGCEEVSEAPQPRLYDLVQEQDYIYPNGRRKVRMRGGKVVKRDPSKITHIVVHQTAVEFGVSERAVKRANGDRELALARRALDVACHVMAFRSGFYVHSHPFVDHVNHGNGYNAYSLGLEIDGRYPGLADDPNTAAREDLKTTWGGKPTVLTDKTIRSACAAIGYMVTRGRAMGMPLTHIVAHRQSSPIRRSDPGEDIWKNIVVEFAEKELGLQVSLYEVLESRKGPGRPIPKQWDARSDAEY